MPSELEEGAAMVSRWRGIAGGWWRGHGESSVNCLRVVVWWGRIIGSSGVGHDAIGVSADKGVLHFAFRGRGFLL